MHGGQLWAQHPHVRSGSQLLFRERMADRLKAGFGSWTFLLTLNAFIAVYCVLSALHFTRFDPYPFIALNLILSWLAAQQGGALQIASNRGDRISAEVQAGTHANSAKLLELQEQQMEILARLGRLDRLPDDVAGLAEAVRVAVAARKR